MLTLGESLPSVLKEDTADGGGSGIDGKGGGVGGVGVELGSVLELELELDMEEIEDKTIHNNIDVIYKYTEEYLKETNKSIDNLTSKLTSILAFSGVLLKFVDDMPAKGDEWIFRIGIAGSLLITIGCCVAGLYPQDAGKVLEPWYLLEPQQYRAADEIIKLQIVDQWRKGIPSLRELLERRTSCFKLAVSWLAVASAIFALKIIVQSVA